MNISPLNYRDLEKIPLTDTVQSNRVFRAIRFTETHCNLHGDQKIQRDQNGLRGQRQGGLQVAAQSCRRQARRGRLLRNMVSSHHTPLNAYRYGQRGGPYVA